MKKVAIIYHYLALYRLPIFQELMSDESLEYTLFSGIDSEIEIKKIESDLASAHISSGGLRWKFLSNKWLLNKKFLWQSGLMSMVLRDEFDFYIFLGSPYHLSTWIGAALARLKGRRVFYWMHGVYKEHLGLVDYCKLYLFYKIAHGFFLYGNRAAGILKLRKIKPAKNIFVVYNSLDHRKSLSLRTIDGIGEGMVFRKKYFIDPGLPTVAFIGRVNAVKRLDLLITAQKLLKDKYGRHLFNTIIVGDGPEVDALKNMSAHLDLYQSIVFTGAIYDENINSYILKHADLCVTPGEVGLTAIHALSYGTPVISHNNLNIQMPEVEAISPGFNGDLYAFDDVSDLASKLENWFLNHPFKTEEIMKNCYEVVDRYYNPGYQCSVFNQAIMMNS